MKRTICASAMILAFAAPLWAADGAAFATIMAHYEPVRQALLADTMKDVDVNGRAIAAELRALGADFSAARARISARWSS